METGTTETDSTVTFRIKNAPSGDYTTTVNDVTAVGLTWDDISPPNSFSKYQVKCGCFETCSMDPAANTRC